MICEVLIMDFFSDDVIAVEALLNSVLKNSLPLLWKSFQVQDTNAIQIFYQGILLSLL